MPLVSGACLGPYEILAPIGAGGMGEVYRAHDARPGRGVALKILPVRLANNPDRRARFETEARAASGLNHPGIVTIHDIGNADGVRIWSPSSLTERACANRGRKHCGGNSTVPRKSEALPGIRSRLVAGWKIHRLCRAAQYRIPVDG